MQNKVKRDGWCSRIVAGPSYSAMNAPPMLEPVYSDAAALTRSPLVLNATVLAKIAAIVGMFILFGIVTGWWLARFSGPL
jgi:hypothetical protein